MALIFYVFSAVLLTAGAMVTLTQRSVHAVLWLILAFVAASGLWILIEAEFLGLMLIVVYVGAVMTLFLFVVMMLNLSEENRVERGWRHWIGFIAVFMMMAAMIILSLSIPDIINRDLNTEILWAQSHDLRSLGIALYSDYPSLVELAAVILLVGIVGAIYLTHETRVHRKKQIIAEQHKVTKQDRLKNYI
ncbi:MAG: NADH-quinone oxidoreductase subunit J [Gammaproteobacteria bacterium]|nr:NADH-quinone oxidoreductase subunit J [Gammaproteobacteria bacterium]